MALRKKIRASFADYGFDFSGLEALDGLFSRRAAAQFLPATIDIALQRYRR
jgi:hypothetical protein